MGDERHDSITPDSDSDAADSDSSATDSDSLAERLKKLWSAIVKYAMGIKD